MNLFCLTTGLAPDMSKSDEDLDVSSTGPREDTKGSPRVADKEDRPGRPSATSTKIFGSRFKLEKVALSAMCLRRSCMFASLFTNVPGVLVLLALSEIF